MNNTLVPLHDRRPSLSMLLRSERQMSPYVELLVAASAANVSPLWCLAGEGIIVSQISGALRGSAAGHASGTSVLFIGGGDITNKLSATNLDTSTGIGNGSGGTSQ